MRIAVVSDIHGNLTAFDAILADLRATRPDLVVHGGDLAGGGSSEAEVIDRIRDRQWPGVYGNTDEMLWAPEHVSRTLQAPALHTLRDAILTEMIPATRRALGDARIAWLRALPPQWSGEGLAVVHARPGDAWLSPGAGAPDEELRTVYAPLASRIAVYGHIHQPFVRRMPTMTVVNSGSVSLSYDGDPRASYALIDDDAVQIRRVAYDVEKEIRRAAAARAPYASWFAQILRTARPVVFAE